jgi:hypothetical protein
MSFLKKSLEKRIRELRNSIEAQKTELAAYEQVLALESGKPMPALSSAPPVVIAALKKHSLSQPFEKQTKIAGPPIAVEFKGSRSDFIASVLKSRGPAGVTPSEISTAFAARKIAVGQNLVYNVLSLMFKQNKVRKSDGKYYFLAAGATKKAKK